MWDCAIFKVFILRLEEHLVHVENKRIDEYVTRRFKELNAWRRLLRRGDYYVHSD